MHPITTQPNETALTAYDYPLPESAIARYPAQQRDKSRLLVLDRSTGNIYHSQFSRLAEWLKAGDLLVRNTTRVIPARFYVTKPDTGARIEILLLRPDETVPGDWFALMRPSKRLKAETTLEAPEGISIHIQSLPHNGQPGRVRFDDSLRPQAVMGWLERHGEMPLPPYMGRKAEATDRERYQTVYAQAAGSVAAPTAGLHFTEALFNGLSGQGIHTADLTLHVGMGTFRPVVKENIFEHVMDPEWYELPEACAEKIHQTRANGGRVVAVGTTSVKTLETVAPDSADGSIVASSGWSRLFISPGHQFKAVDAMITNFHLPKSTLLMLISAFAGREQVLAAYEEAIREGYRFYSYGDAMLIL